MTQPDPPTYLVLASAAIRWASGRVDRVVLTFDHVGAITPATLPDLREEALATADEAAERADTGEGRPPEVRDVIVTGWSRYDDEPVEFKPNPIPECGALLVIANGRTHCNRDAGHDGPHVRMLTL